MPFSTTISLSVSSHQWRSIRRWKPALPPDATVRAASSFSRVLLINLSIDHSFNFAVVILLLSITVLPDRPDYRGSLFITTPLRHGCISLVLRILLTACVSLLQWMRRVYQVVHLYLISYLFATRRFGVSFSMSSLYNRAPIQVASLPTCLERIRRSSRCLLVVSQALPFNRSLSLICASSLNKAFNASFVRSKRSKSPNLSNPHGIRNLQLFRGSFSTLVPTVE